jgi:hypothetical protein
LSAEYWQGEKLAAENDIERPSASTALHSPEEHDLQDVTTRAAHEKRQRIALLATRCRDFYALLHDPSCLFAARSGRRFDLLLGL